MSWLGLCLLLVLLVGALGGRGDASEASAQPAVRVDDEGVMRWEDTGEEVVLFGVNYCTPFAYGYRAHGYVGADRELAIAQDLAHLARLGVDALRIHLWDREISDRQGNLLDNDHLRLLDHMIHQAAARGMSVLITAIGWWNPQYPEPEEDNTSPGFSNYYSKAQMATDPEARRAQVNYLRQLMEHVNRYRGRAYKDDPAIIAVELFNEPSNPGSREEIREYIDALAEAVRATGCRKPILYNASQGFWIGLVEALRDSTAEGATFGWYPSGLVAGRSLRGNFLPRVDDYPLSRAPQLARKAKLVYEFDAADVPGSHMYPAIARTLRSAGMQWATMFAYDPLALASSNTEYQTHYLNLVYTPNKAVSLLIAGEAFRRLPRGGSYQGYPENTRFGPFRVSYEEDLSELVTEREFLYSNDTSTQPPAPESLERVVGCGTSPVVRYEGTGSYFLEKLEPGVWRLEVYPDAIWVDDPFGRPCLDREVSRVLWREWPMEIRLPDLGQRFSVAPLNKDNDYRVEAAGGRFPIRPGVYLLARQPVSAEAWTPDSPFGRLTLGEFVAPPARPRPPLVLHEPPLEVVEGQPLALRATVVSDEVPERVTLHLRQSTLEPFRSLSMARDWGYRWTAQIPPGWLQTGALEYCISIHLGGEARTYPADVPGTPDSSDFAWPQPHLLFSVHGSDGQSLLHPPEGSHTRATAEVAAGSQHEAYALRLSTGAPANRDAAWFTARLTDAGAVSLLWQGKSALVISARACDADSDVLRVGLVDNRGDAYVTEVALTTDWRDWRVPFVEFSPSRGWIGRLRPQEAAELRFAPGAQFRVAQVNGQWAVEVERVSVEPLLRYWTTPVVSTRAPFRLFDAARDWAHVVHRGGKGYRAQLVPGTTPDTLALRVAKPDGRPAAFRHTLWPAAPLRSRPEARFDALRVRARAPGVSKAELSLELLDTDDRAWAAALSLTDEWRELRLPLTALRRTTVMEVPFPYFPFSAEASGDLEAKSALSGRDLLRLAAVQVGLGNERGSFEVEEIALEGPR